MFVGNVQTIRKRVKNKQSKKKYKKNERKKIEWKSENSKKKKEKRKSSEKEGGGVARILFFNWVIYDPSDDLRSYSDDDCFVFTVRKKTTRSSWFFFFFARHSPFLPSRFFLASLNLSAFSPPFFLLRTTRRQTSNVLFCYVSASFSAYTLAYASSCEDFSFFPFSFFFFARCGLGKKDSARKKKILEAAKRNEHSRRTMGLGVPTMLLIFMGFFGLKRCVHVGDFLSSPASHRCGCFIGIVKSLRLERIFFSSRRAPDQTLGSPTRAKVTKSSRKNSWKKSWKNSRLNEIRAKTVIMNSDVVISCWTSCITSNYRCFLTTDRPNYR